MLYEVITISLAIFVSLPIYGQINTDRMLTIGKNALYFEDYVLAIQYFNKVIRVKPYLADPYFYRGLSNRITSYNVCYTKLLRKQKMLI